MIIHNISDNAGESIRDSILVKYVENSDNQYEVSFKSNYSDHMITALVTVGVIDGKVKIVKLG